MLTISDYAQRSADGVPGAREALARAVRDLAVRALRGMRARPEVAEELAQDVTLRVLRALEDPEMRVGGKGDGFVRVCARNALVSHARRRTHAVGDHVDLDRLADDSDGTLQDPAATFAGLHDRAHRADAVHDALGELSPSDCELLRLIYLDDPPSTVADLVLREVGPNATERDHALARQRLDTAHRRAKARLGARLRSRLEEP